MARPAIVVQLLFQARLLGAHLLVDAGNAIARAARRLGQARVVGFRAAHHRIDQRDPGGTKIEGSDRGAVARLHYGGRTVAR